MPSPVPIALCAALALGCSSRHVIPESFTPAEAREILAAPQPAPGPYPTPPGIEFTPGEPPPAPVDLPANGAVVGRLTEQGQVAQLRFTATKGELSLFALTAYGYARGWNAQSRLIVRNADGEILADRVRAGQALFDDFLPFLAREDGAYTLEVVAEEHSFRYLVVRHTGYHAQLRGDALALPAGGDEVAHGWTGGPGARQRFIVHATPGAPLYLRAEPTADRGRNSRRAYRARTAAVQAGFVDPARLEGEQDPRLRRDDSFPELELEVVDRISGAIAEPLDVLSFAGAAALLRVPSSGLLLVTVAQVSEGPGGLFDLVVDRGVRLAPLRLRVGDADDDPLPDVEIALLREPELELLAHGRTGADGTLTLTAPPGAYTIVHRAPGRGPVTVRAAISADEPLNLVAAD